MSFCRLRRQTALRRHRIVRTWMRQKVRKLREAIRTEGHGGSLNGHDPYRYLADVLGRLPTQPASQLDELLPHQWQPRS